MTEHKIGFRTVRAHVDKPPQGKEKYSTPIDPGESVANCSCGWSKTFPHEFALTHANAHKQLAELEDQYFANMGYDITRATS